MASLPLPDGRVITFPDGLQPDQVKKIIDAAQGKKAIVPTNDGGFDQFKQMFQSGQMNPSSSVHGDVARQFQKGLGQGTAGLTAFPAQIGEWLGDKATQGLDYMTGREHHVPVRDPSPLNPANLPQIAERAMGIGKAAGMPGEYANTAGQFLPSTLIGGPLNMGKKLLTAMSSAGGSESAGQAVRGTKYQHLEPYVRVGGALAAPAAVSTARRLVTPFPISPERKKIVAALKGEGVDLTAGQTTGSTTLRYAESELGGGKAAQMIETQGEQFTAAALRRAGIDAKRATPEVLDQAFTRIGNQFDDLSARNALLPDAKLAQDISASFMEYAGLVAPNARAPVVHKMATDVLNAAQSGMSGKQFQSYSSRLGTMARKTVDPQLKEALYRIKDSLDDAMERGLQKTGSPDLGAWREARNQYRNIIVIEKAATGAGEKAAEGIISPSALRNATVQKHGQRNYARGKGNFAELARAGEATMKPLPQSGTAPRQAVRAAGMTIPAILGTMAGSPAGPAVAVLGGLSGAALPYAAGRALMSKPARAYLVNQLLAKSKNLTAAERALIASIGAGTSVSNSGNR